VRILTLSLLAVSLTACYNKEFNEPGKVSFERRPTERAFDADIRRTWAAVEKVFARFSVAESRAESGSAKAYLVTDWITGKSDVLYSGFDRSRVPYTIRYKLYVYVQGSRGRTKITIKNVEQYRDDVITAGVDFDGSIMTWIRTESSTLKEATLLDEIQRVLEDKNFAPSR
jgi:hypothetical protein